MTTEQIIEGFKSKDVSGIRQAACAIISVSQEREKILPFIPFRSLIFSSTDGLEMGGAFAPNQRFVDYALQVIDFHAAGHECPCSLYSDFKYECNDPNQEKVKGNITIEAITRIENKWVDFYSCTCQKCGQSFKVYEREGHYTWWKWEKL